MRGTLVRAHNHQRDELPARWRRSSCTGVWVARRRGAPAQPRNRANARGTSSTPSAKTPPTAPTRAHAPSVASSTPATTSDMLAATSATSCTPACTIARGEPSQKRPAGGGVASGYPAVEIGLLKAGPLAG